MKSSITKKKTLLGFVSGKRVVHFRLESRNHALLRLKQEAVKGNRDLENCECIKTAR